MDSMLICITVVVMPEGWAACNQKIRASKISGRHNHLAALVGPMLTLLSRQVDLINKKWKLPTPSASNGYSSRCGGLGLCTDPTGKA